MIHKSCKDCAGCFPASEYRVQVGGRVWFNAMCRKCKAHRTAVANAACKARKRVAEQPDGPTPFIPPTDFLAMGPAANAPLVWSIGRAAA